MAKGVGGKKKLKFKTTKRVETTKRRIWIAAFVAVVLILAAVSVVTYLKDHPTSKAPGDDSGELTSQPVQTLKEHVGLLMAGVKTDTGEVLILTHITINTNDKSFTVTPLPASKISSTKAAEISAEAAKKFNLDVDRYVVITEKKFKSFMGALGLYEVNIEKKIDYKGDDFSLSLLPGKQKLTGDNLFKYLRFMGLGESEYELEKQGDVIADIIKQRVNESNAQKGDDLFSPMINSCESDITIVDFQKYNSFFAAVAKEARNVEVKLISTEE